MIPLDPFLAPKNLDLDKAPTHIKPFSSIEISSIHKSLPEIINYWMYLYLHSFGRKAYLSKNRVFTLLQNTAHALVEPLTASDLNSFSRSLDKTGKFFFEIGIPFEEVLLFIHLFQEACLRKTPIFFDSKNNNSSEAARTLEALCKFGTSKLAFSYFKSAKSEWSRMLSSSEEEISTKTARINDLNRLANDYKSKDLPAMSSAIGAINKKIQRNDLLYQNTQRISLKIEKANSSNQIVDIVCNELSKHFDVDQEILVATCHDPDSPFDVYGRPDDAAGLAQEKNTSSSYVTELARGSLPPLFIDKFDTRKDSLMFVKKNSLDPQAILPCSKLKKISEYALLPMRWRGEMMGWIWIASSQNGIIDKGNIRFFRHVSKIAANALFGLSYHAKFHKQAALSQSLRNLKISPEEHSTLETALDYYLGELMESLGVERVSLMLLNTKQRALRTFAAKGYRVYPFSGVILKWGQGIAGSSLKEARTICVSRMRSSIHKKKNVKSLACIPLFIDSNPIGVLNASTLNYHKKFDSLDIQSANRIASYLAETLSRNGVNASNAF